MIRETILLALRAIRRNVLRSFLTILGIVIGVAAVITMVTLGGGATAQVTAEIAALGTNMLHVRPGQGFHGPGGRRMAANPFTIEDAEAIRREIFGLEAVAPASTKGAQVIHGNRNWNTTVMGVTNDYLKVRDWDCLAGRLFSGNEARAGRTVCLIGTTVRDEIFDSENPLGARIRLNKLACQVVGVLAAKGQSSFGRDQDNLVLLPLRTFQRRMQGGTDVETIYVSALDGVSTSRVQADIEQLMRERRRILPGQNDDFHVRDMQEIVGALTGTTRVMTALLSAVAAVSLLVGGIGIMNIMLVSVTERTREIGTRLAIGALARNVLLQFLIEAMVLSLFGGFFGIILGLAAAGAGSRLLGVPFILNPGIIIIAFAFSAAVGVVFGFFPARQAACLDPIDALRHE